ncbi:MAG TPA: hypothetical protein VNH19_04330 [Candidatus Limnocylindrales bacterium]|nr:hypothetical protein [Candidatus Limnocylindrales bacterium]
MNPRKFLRFAVIAAVLPLFSCSGVKNVCTSNCGGGGSNGSLNLTLAATPFTPPPNTSILSFAVLINSVSLTPSAGGSDVTIPLNNSSFGVDLTRLQSDSAYLGQFINSVPTGTYNQLSVNLNAVVTYCAATSGTPGCNSGSIAQISKAFASATTSNFSFTMGANQQAGLRVVINFANALTVNPATQAVTAINLTAANVVATATLPPTLSTLSAGQLDYLEDVTGVITAASSSSVTVQTATRGPITSVITGSTLVSPDCLITNLQNQACAPAVGQVVSMDSTLNADGTSSMLLFDPLSLTSVDLIEGIVTSETASSTQFQIVANDVVKANSNSLIGGLSLGDTVNVSLANLIAGFFIDGKGLPLTSSSFNGSNSATDIHTGQTVMVRVKAFTPKSGSTPASATADAVVLRFTRFAAAATGAGAPQFSVGSLPPFFGFTTLPLVQLGNGNPITYLDGYPSSGSITSGDNLGIRALYFGTNVSPSFSAAKIRKN